MYCPSCGNQNSEDQRFCRSCGLRLETISQVVNQELQQIPDFVPERGPGFSWKSIFFTAWYYGFFLIGLGLIIISVGKKIIGEQLVADIGSVMSLLGVALLVSRGILLLKGTLTPRPPQFQKKTDTTPLLEQKEPASATEFTTRHLETVYSERHDPQSSPSERESRS
jgi:zinc-ribbon domain